MAVCRVCNRLLRNPLSIERGVGPTCARKVNMVITQQFQQPRIRMKDYTGTNEFIKKAELLLIKTNKEKRKKNQKIKGKLGTKRLSGTKTETNDSVLQKVLYDKEKSIRENSFESAYVYDTKGNLIWFGDGTSNFYY